MTEIQTTQFHRFLPAFDASQIMGHRSQKKIDEFDPVFFPSKDRKVVIFLLKIEGKVPWQRDVALYTLNHIFTCLKMTLFIIYSRWLRAVGTLECMMGRHA